jgi:hypothetical protein
MELDIYIPSEKIAIEYDGMVWHKAGTHYDRELRKYQICQKHGIRLIRVREDKDQVDTSTSDIVAYISPLPTTEDFVQLFQQLSSVLSIPQDVDIDKDRLAIASEYLSVLKQNSFAVSQPLLADEWDYDLHENLLPSMINEHSNLRVWWKCKNGHSWKAAVHSRSQGNGCPFCAGQRAVSGENDLATVCPNLLAEWDYSKNPNVNPANILPGSNKSVWWKCSRGHSWKTVIYNRAIMNTACPYCAGQRVISGETDFATKYPKLLEEWNYDKNTTVDPHAIAPTVKTKVWWQCSEGHE